MLTIIMHSAKIYLVITRSGDGVRSGDPALMRKHDLCPRRVYNLVKETVK